MRFEYLRKFWTIGYDFDKDMNDLGKDGWELVNVNEGQWGYTAYFKREVIAQALLTE